MVTFLIFFLNYLNEWPLTILYKFIRDQDQDGSKISVFGRSLSYLKKYTHSYCDNRYSFLGWIYKYTHHCKVMEEEQLGQWHSLNHDGRNYKYKTIRWIAYYCSWPNVKIFSWPQVPTNLLIPHEASRRYKLIPLGPKKPNVLAPNNIILTKINDFHAWRVQILSCFMLCF